MCVFMYKVDRLVCLLELFFLLPVSIRFRFVLMPRYLRED